jgi:glucans biosynthesis protein C
LLVYEFVLGPLVLLGVYRSLVSASMVTGETLPPYWQFYVGTLDPGPLWFVEMLLIFAGLYALVRSRLSARLPTRGARRPPSGYREIILFTVVLAAVTFLWRLVVPMGLYGPILGLPTLAHLPQYASLFVVGSIAYRGWWFAAIPSGAASRGLGAALASLVLLPVALIGLPAFTGGLHWQAALYALWEAIVSAGLEISLLAAFQRYLVRTDAPGRFLSRQAYAVYVLPAPLIVGLAYAIRDLTLAPLFKFALATVIAVPLCFSVAYAVRKLPLARSIL